MKTTPLLFSTIIAAHIFGLPLAAQAGTDAAIGETPIINTEKAPPLPVHTIEGVGGLVITPIAYLVNPGPTGTNVGLPSVSTSYINIGRKNLEAAALTETLFGRVKLGYSIDRFENGTLPDDVRKATTISIPDSVVLHNFNARVLALPENSFDLPLPALTLGATGKYNEGISTVNKDSLNVLNAIGYKSNNGVDFTLTSTKAFSQVFGRPLIATAGLRWSEAEHLGFVGFSNKYHTTFESSVAYSILDELWLAVEFRGNANAYDQTPNPKGGAGRVPFYDFR